MRSLSFYKVPSYKISWRPVNIISLLYQRYKRLRGFERSKTKQDRYFLDQLVICSFLKVTSHQFHELEISKLEDPKSYPLQEDIRERCLVRGRGGVKRPKEKLRPQLRLRAALNLGVAPDWIIDPSGQVSPVNGSLCNISVSQWLERKLSAPRALRPLLWEDQTSAGSTFPQSLVTMSSSDGLLMEEGFMLHKSL